MAKKIGTDVARRARKYAARQHVADYEIAPHQAEIPLSGGSFRPMREEIEAARSAWVRDFVERE